MDARWKEMWAKKGCRPPNQIRRSGLILTSKDERGCLRNHWLAPFPEHGDYQAEVRSEKLRWKRKNPRLSVYALVWKA